MLPSQCDFRAKISIDMLIRHKKLKKGDPYSVANKRCDPILFVYLVFNERAYYRLLTFC